MSISVIANLMTFVNDAAHEVGIGLPILADDKECRRHILPLQNVQYVRSPFGIGTVVECQRDKSGMVAAALNDVGGRCRDKVFAFYETAGGVHFEIAPPVLWARHNLQYFARTFKINV